ncbi:MAG: diguanylate cyclase [Spirochaetales bacterium]|nr:diguanylate cyclase [Spirochaetales bacterium]
MVNKREIAVLVVDDDRFVREMISEILIDQGVSVFQAENGRNALVIFSKHEKIDIIVTDIHMPELDGLGLVDAIRETDKDTPIIILTVNSDIETAVEAIRKGADDYILKGSAIGDTLPLSVAKVLEIYDLKIQNRELLQDLSAKNAELEKLAFLDGLTGIFNRRYYDLTLITKWGSAIREKSPISMIITDVDYFKQLNDVLGHHYGDLCLKRIAKTLYSLLIQSNAILVRYGGDEFIAILQGKAPEATREIAEKMRTLIEQEKIVDPETGQIKQFTMSFGVYGLVPDANSDPEILFENADKALYEAKKQGRNRVNVG